MDGDDDDALPEPASLGVWLGAVLRGWLSEPESPEPLVFVDLPGLACATYPARAPASATAPTQTHLVMLDARRSAASRAVPP
jgi:hypothetical protein